jgi:hypothetical protein
MTHLPQERRFRGRRAGAAGGPEARETAGVASDEIPNVLIKLQVTRYDREVRCAVTIM